MATGCVYMGYYEMLVIASQCDIVIVLFIKFKMNISMQFECNNFLRFMAEPFAKNIKFQRRIIN